MSVPREMYNYLCVLIDRDELTETNKQVIGAKFKPAQYCPKCGAPAIGDFCYNCGQHLLNEITTRSIRVDIIDELIAKNAERRRRNEATMASKVQKGE